MRTTMPKLLLLRKQGWLLFTLVMLLLSLLLSLPARAAMVERDEMVRSVSVSGVAERKVVPDQANVVVTVAATNAKLETAKAEHDKKLRDVMAIAKKVGIEEKHMKTQHSSTQPRYTWENNKQNFKGYQVQTNLEITVKKMESVGGLLEKLSAANLEQGMGQEWGSLIHVAYAISEPEKVRDEMLAEAIKNARKKAENMASAAGASIGSVIQISEGGAPQFHFPVPMMARGVVDTVGSAAMETAPPAGEQAVNANVTVMFELK
jgi:uncharacterized protein YggE